MKECLSVPVVLFFLFQFNAIYAEDVNADLSIKKIPLNLGKNFLQLFRNDNLTPLINGIAGIAISTSLEDDIHGYFSQRNTSGTTETIITSLGDAYFVGPAVVTVLILGHNSKNSRFQSFSYALTQGCLLNTGMTASLKIATSRMRPDSSNDRSFPSGHASNSFMTATLIHQFYGNKAGIISYSIAGIISASRLKKDVHWLSDVVAGASLGTIIGLTVSRSLNAAGDQRLLEFYPAIVPSKKTFGLNLRIQW